MKIVFSSFLVGRILVCICTFITIFCSSIEVLTCLWNILGFHLLASRAPFKTMSGHIWWWVDIFDLDKWMKKFPGLTIKMVSQCFFLERGKSSEWDLQKNITYLPIPHLKIHLCYSINPDSQVLLHYLLLVWTEVALKIKLRIETNNKFLECNNYWLTSEDERLHVYNSPSVMFDSLWPHGLQPSGSFVYGILQARTLEWVAIPFSWGSSQPKNRTLVSSIAGRFFTIWATREDFWR